MPTATKKRIFSGVPAQTRADAKNIAPDARSINTMGQTELLKDFVGMMDESVGSPRAIAKHKREKAIKANLSRKGQA
jgi:hypothetical protein